MIYVNVKNVGTKISSGYNNKDWRVIYEVSSTQPTSDSSVLLQNATNFKINNTTYYPVDIKNYNISLLNSSYTSNRNTYTLESSLEKNDYYYLTNSPLLNPGDDITYSFTGDFEKGKTYAFGVDDIINKNIGDTPEVIDDNVSDSNNYFIFTVPENLYFTSSQNIVIQQDEYIEFEAVSKGGKGGGGYNSYSTSYYVGGGGGGGSGFSGFFNRNNDSSSQINIEITSTYTKISDINGDGVVLYNGSNGNGYGSNSSSGGIGGTVDNNLSSSIYFSGTTMVNGNNGQNGGILSGYSTTSGGAPGIRIDQTTFGNSILFS